MKEPFFLFLSQFSYGGQERFASRLSEMLCNEYDVYIILFDDSSINYPVHGTVISLKTPDFSKSPIKKFFEVAKRCIRFKRALNKYHPVACMSFGRGPNCINLICKQRGTLVLPSIRGYASAERMAVQRIDRLLYPRADKVVCVSKGIQNKIQSDFPKLNGKIALLYNAYDCEQIKALADSQTSQSRQFPSLVSVGTLRPEKGFWHLIKSISVLKHAYPDICLKIVGEDYQDNGKNLRGLVDSLNLKENVFFEGWCSDPYSYIGNSDIYVLSSVREGFPNALVEAMACGKPVVAADCLTGPREILSSASFDTLATEIELAEYGILVPRLSVSQNYSSEIMPEDVKLAEAIKLLLDDCELREKYGILAQNRAMEFSYAKCKENVIELLEE